MVVHAVLWDSELQICSLNWIRKPWLLLLLHSGYLVNKLIVLLNSAYNYV